MAPWISQLRIPLCQQLKWPKWKQIALEAAKSVRDEEGRRIHRDCSRLTLTEENVRAAVWRFLGKSDLYLVLKALNGSEVSPVYVNGAGLPDALWVEVTVDCGYILPRGEKLAEMLHSCLHVGDCSVAITYHVSYRSSRPPAAVT